MSILEQLAQLRTEAEKAISESSAENLNELRLKLFSRKNGSLNNILRGLKDLSAEERPKVGSLANEVKERLEALIAERMEQLKASILEKRLISERIDVTMPGNWQEPGRIHVLNQTMQVIKDTFSSLGYAVVQGPEVETDYYNFEALNIPANHPSREMWDSFFLREGLLMRSHTSPMQVHVMENHKPPIRVIVPGKCYRRDAVDATHFWEFHQVEGLLVDENITFADLKGTLDLFLNKLSGGALKCRFNPSYFPFTEPSAEVLCTCFVCGGKGCRMCKDSGWIEIMGAGMVHPRVLKGVGLDPERYTGFAFGMGVERIAMLSSGIADIRLLFEGDKRFSSQF